MVKSLITCTCSGSQSLDPALLAEAAGIPEAIRCSELCTTELDRAQAALTQGDALICCTQEGRVFETLAEELDAAAPHLLDLRDRAGWTADHGDLRPKMSALLAEALLPAPFVKSLDVTSEGLCLILGPADIALEAAEQLKDYLGVTVLLSEAQDIPDSRAYDVVLGQLRKAQGALGQFQVSIDRLQQIIPGGRGAFQLTEPQDGAQSVCDILLDLRRDPPLFPAHEKREGYLRANPSHAPSVARAVLAASHLVGVFEKPLYVKTEPMLCAHSRAEQTGCSRCLDLCPTGAITPHGDHISVDPMICAGCGACSSTCPSGAISYDAPPVDLTMQRVQTLAKAYQAAGGQAPRLLVHDAHGAEMIRLSARYGDGLPADVIPLEMSALGAFGHAEALAALAAGFAHISWLPGPGVDRAALEAELALTNALGLGKAQLIETNDPEALSQTLYSQDPTESLAQPVRPMGSRRQIVRLAVRALNPDADQLPLPQGAPYGAVQVDTESCTLCLSCVSLCPSGALGDNPDRPQLRFQEDACLQCGLCAKLCPEDAITYDSRMDLTEAALRQEVLHEEEPFACVSCGTPFGVKSTIEKITEKLQSHAMFQGGDKLRMIQMCDDCRVEAQFHSQDNPFMGGERPKPRTTADYLSARKDH